MTFDCKTIERTTEARSVSSGSSSAANSDDYQCMSGRGSGVFGNRLQMKANTVMSSVLGCGAGAGGVGSGGGGVASTAPTLIPTPSARIASLQAGFLSRFLRISPGCLSTSEENLMPDVLNAV